VLVWAATLISRGRRDLQAVAAEKGMLRQPRGCSMFTMRGRADLPDLVFPALRDYIYLWQDPGARTYQIGGITFQEFLLGVERPINLLLLRHQFPCPLTDSRGRYEFVNESELARLARDNIYGYGDFSWVDFQSEDALSHLEGRELLELLYLKEFGRPLGAHRFPTLQNRYTYCAHDDGFYLQLHAHHAKDLERILAKVLSIKYLAFSGRRSRPIPNEEIAETLASKETVRRLCPCEVP
jgi:hypothetical protein